MELIYFGKKEEIGPCEVFVKVKYFNGASCNEELKNVGTHSPDGFQWGHSGSGPTDLAISILNDFLKRKGIKDIKVSNCQNNFKNDFIAIEKNDLEISSKDIEKWLENK